MNTDPLVDHFADTLRLIEAMAIDAAMKSMPKLPFGAKLGEPKPWDEWRLRIVAERLAEGARMAAAEKPKARRAAA